MSKPASLRWTILVRVIPLSMLALALVAVAARYLTRRAITDEVNRRLDSKAWVSAVQLADRLEFLRSSVRGLAENDLIINSIVDAQQRDQHLVVFFRSLQLPSKAFRRAAMMDYRGRPMVSNRNEAWVEPGEFIEVVMNGQDFFHIDADRILMVVPVRYNGLPEAMIAVEYRTSAFLQEFEIVAAADRFRLLDGTQVLFDSLDVGTSSRDATGTLATASSPDPGQWIRVQCSLDGYAGLCVEQSESRESAFAALRSVNYSILGALAASLVAVLLGIYVAAHVATRPLTQFVSAIRSIQESQDLSKRVRTTGSVEVHQLTDAFNEMIQSLSQTTVSHDRLVESETRLRTVIESVPTGIVATDLEGTMTLVNDRFATLMGYQRRELLGQSIQTVVPAFALPAPIAKTNHAELDVMRWDVDETQVWVGRHRSGLEIPIEVDVSPVTLLHGPGLLASVDDITHRQAQERRNEKLRRETQMILDSIPAMVFFKDTTNRLTRVNQAAADVIGARPDEIEGRHSSEFFADHEKYFNDDLEVMRSGQPRLGIVETVTTPNGPTRWVSTDKIPVFDDGDDLRGIIAVVHDITEFKMTTAALERANEQLKRSNDELAQFAYVASHDMQEPLRKVISYCDLLFEDYGDRLDADGKKFMGYVVDGATRMRTLIQDLLKFSRISDRERSWDPVQLGEAVTYAIENLSQSIEEAEATVTVGELPMVLADASQMVQLFQNLIANAVKYRGDAKPIVDIQAESHPDHWQITVRDNGIGIEPQYHEQVFGVFKRLHSMDTYTGTGIGLAICKRIVERVDGELWVESNADVGSTFFVNIPKRDFNADLPNNQTD